MGKRVLVTGGSGYLGGVLLKALLGRPGVERVVSLDLKPPRRGDPRLRHLAADIRDPFLLRTLLDEERIDTVFHLAFMMGEPRDAVLAREVNLGGTLSVLEACDKAAGVSRLILSASASAYGARRGNPPRLTEDDPLRADTLTYGRHKREVEEELAKALPRVRPSLQTTVLRICTIVGGSERSEGPVKTFCELPAAVSVLFHEGALQFIAEEDLIEVMMRVMEAPEFRGVYNVAPDDHTTVAEICRELGKPRVPVPYGLLWLAFYLARRLLPRASVTEHIVGYLAHPVVIDNSRIKKALGVEFRRGSLESFLDCARSLSS